MSPGVAVARFAEALRAAGIPVGADASVHLTMAASAVGFSLPFDLYHAWRAVSVSAAEHLPVFDRTFAEFFGLEAIPGTYLVSDRHRTWTISGDGSAGEGEGDRVDLTARIGASAVERLAHRDFAELTPTEAAQVRNMIATMIWRPSLRKRRRYRPAPIGNRLDLRRMVRAAATSDVIELKMARRRQTRRPLVVIADVSGSMEQYAEMLLYFTHAARGRLGKLEAFVFSTHLTRITRQLLRREAAAAIASVAETVEDWSGGTKIGEAVRTFNNEWSRRVTRGGPVAILVSDGWDRGDPEVLGEEMARLRRTVHRLIWLNPLAGRPGFAPETRGMQAALPHVDDFLPSANLNDLATLVDLLESIPARR